MSYIRNIYRVFHLMLATLLESFIFVVYQVKQGQMVTASVKNALHIHAPR